MRRMSKVKTLAPLPYQLVLVEYRYHTIFACIFAYLVYNQSSFFYSHDEDDRNKGKEQLARL